MARGDSDADKASKTASQGADDGPLFNDTTPEGLGLTWVNRYEILEQIGVGAMGIVYRVNDSMFACERALKILRAELVHETDILMRFREEGKAAVRAAGEISHPNIVTVYDAGEFEGRPYIVMELFPGIPLDEKISGGHKMDVLEVLSIGIQLAGALGSAHTHGVVHRDIKPGNVLVSETNALAKLTDFSVAQLKANANSSLTRTGVVIGAPRYMPPEQALGKEVDGRSDLYGLGIMLYELLTGEKAYQSETFTALLIEISQTKLPPIRTVNKDIPPGVERIISKLVEKDPERRFQNAGDLQTAMRREIRSINANELRSKRGMPTELLGAALLSALVGVLLCLAGYVLRDQQINALEEQTAAVGMAYADTLADQFSLDYSRVGESAGLLYEVQFNESSASTNLDFQKIVLDNGTILASTFEDENDYAGFEQLRVLQIDNENASASLIRLPDGRQSMQVARKIEIGPNSDRESIGTLFVGLSTERINNIGKLTVSFMLLMSLLVASLIGFVSYYLIRRFARPLELMRDNLRLVAAGDDDIRMPAGRDGLIGDAFSAFNSALGAMTALPAIESKAEPVPLQDMSDMKVPEVISTGLASTSIDEETIIVSMGGDADSNLDDIAQVLNPDDIVVDDRTLVFRLHDDEDDDDDDA